MRLRFRLWRMSVCLWTCGQEPVSPGLISLLPRFGARRFFFVTCCSGCVALSQSEQTLPSDQPFYFTKLSKFRKSPAPGATHSQTTEGHTKNDGMCTGKQDQGHYVSQCLKKKSHLKVSVLPLNTSCSHTSLQIVLPFSTWLIPPKMRQLEKWPLRAPRGHRIPDHVLKEM